MSKGPIASLELQKSEAHVLAAASRLLAARIAAGLVAPADEGAALESCVRQAIEMAVRIDRLLQSEDEHSGAGTWNSRV